MFVIDSYGIQPPRRLSPKERAANLLSVALIKRKWDTFDDETRMQSYSM
jgi:hypothetical protein